MKRANEAAAKPGSIGTAISLIALLISGLSFWNAHQALRLSEESSLPELSETTELLQPLAPGEPFNVKIVITNFGHTTARQMTPFLGYAFAKADVPFDPTLPFSSQATQAANFRSGAWGPHDPILDE